MAKTVSIYGKCCGKKDTRGLKGGGNPNYI
jgi:hypothetical protein